MQCYPKVGGVGEKGIQTCQRQPNCFGSVEAMLDEQHSVEQVDEIHLGVQPVVGTRC